MNKEDIIYNQYQEIIKVYSPLRDEIVDLEFQRCEILKQIDLMEYELSKRINEADVYDEERNKLINKKIHKLLDIIYLIFILIPFISLLVEDIRNIIFNNFPFLISIFLLVISFILIANFIYYIIYYIGEILIDLTYGTILRIIHKKANRYEIRELEEKIKKENDKVKNIDEKLSNKHEILSQYKDKFKVFVENIYLI